MNYYTIVTIFSFAIFIPAVVGWLRFKETSPIFFPFFLLIWLGALNEIVSYIIVDILGLYNIFNYNLFLLIQSLILTWQFQRWNLFGYNRKIPLLIIFIFVGVWLIENLFISKFYLGF